jgi:hypothetical protein
LYTKSRTASKWKSGVYKREANVYEGAARAK